MKNKGNFERFLESARRGKRVEHNEPPFGFSTRVAARAFAGEREEALLLWERLAFKGLAVALVLALCVGTGVIRIQSARPSTLSDFAGIADTQESLW